MLPIHWFVCIVALLPVVYSNLPVTRSPGHGPQVSYSNSEQPHTRSTLSTVSRNKEGFLSSIGKNFELLTRGSSGLINNVQKSISLWQLERKEGTAALSYTDFQFLEQAKADLLKTVKLAATIPLSPQYFFYSYLVFPMLSSNNPWAWRALPSTFDRAELKSARDKAVTERRMQAVVSGLHILLGEVVESAGSWQVHEGKARAVGRIRDALEQQNMSASLEALGPWLRSRGERAARGLQLGGMPGSVVRQGVRALGGDGVPNIPIVRTLNNWQLNGRIKKVRRSDDFLLQKGVAALSPAEVGAACFERCIGTEDRPPAALREDLAEWLALSGPCATQATQAASRDSAGRGTAAAVGTPEDRLGMDDSREHSANHSSGGGRSAINRTWWGSAAPVAVPNPQNRRLAMMALHTARSLRSSAFGAAYRALLQPTATTE